MKYRLLIILAALLAVTGISQGATIDREAESAKVSKKLQTARTAQDSLPFLYDLFDLSLRTGRAPIAAKIYEVAGRAHDEEAQLDVLRLSAAIANSPKEFDKLDKAVKTLPKTQEQKETEVFLNMARAAFNARQPGFTIDSKQMAATLRKIISTPAEKQNPYDRLLNVFTITTSLRNNPKSPMLLEYLDTLVNMANHSDYHLYAITNQIYTQAAVIYSEAGEYKKSVEAGKKLLSVINGLEKHYRSHGRHYRNYEEIRYAIYRRQLRNYKALSMPEVEHYFSCCLELAQANPDIAKDLKNNQEIYAYHYLAHGDYAKALPILQRRVESDKITDMSRRRHYMMIIDAATALGDTTVLVSAMKKLDSIDDRYNSDNIIRRYQELQIAYNLDKLKSENAELQQEKEVAADHSRKQTMTHIISIWIVAFILLFLLIYYWSRYRKNTAHLARFARMIKRQRDSLKHGRYTDYGVIHWEEDSPLLRSSDARILLQSILSDILYISAIGHDDRMTHITSASMTQIMNKSVEEARKLAGPDAVFKMEYPEEDFRIVTDPECLKYLTDHILVYAYRHSQNHEVTFTAKRIPDTNIVTLVFTHTGNRIPEGKEETLFTDFMDWDSLHYVDDSSLFICRMIAFLLRCNITYNPRPDGNPELVYSIPLDWRKP